MHAFLDLELGGAERRLQTRRHRRPGIGEERCGLHPQDAQTMPCVDEDFRNLIEGLAGDIDDGVLEAVPQRFDLIDAALPFDFECLPENLGCQTQITGSQGVADSLPGNQGTILECIEPVA